MMARRKRRAGERRRAAFDTLAFLVLLGGLGWLLFEGAGTLHYNWQWYRVPQYLYRIENGAFHLGPLLRGLAVTLELSAWSLLLALLFGLTAALLQRSMSWAGHAVARVYVEVVRNTPMLVQLYLVYFVLAPILGMDRFAAAVLALAIFEGAYAAEIFRAGIEAVPRGQWEAAQALGLSRQATYRRVILPQAVRVVLPPLTGLGVSLIKHSALVSVIAVADLTTEGRNLIADTFMTFELWFTVAALYLALTTSLSLLVGWLERRLAVSGGHG
ncbi:MAG: amino acid ABC transporter permease [Candidatus Competibacteraceae bacterium]|nr:amino acid ABC transporter permease [Candidatus Competibacteraceae bacterium]MBK8897912.1 amino acid ABC transporter permease [Candidatus Competibacteraceae bacterium]MBK9950934.1 amino acid ABC transporter permease [Candidatus Competibacteraceae bacterium]